MTDESSSNEEQNEEQQPRKRGSMRFQDAESTKPREPTLAEQRARRRALLEEKEREAAEEQARADADRKAGTRRKVFIGSGVTVGLVGLVAGWYLVATPDEVTAVCTDANGTVVENDDYCDEDYVASQGGYTSGGFVFLPIVGGGYQQYRYNYGGTGAVGSTVSGGSYSKPANANISTKSGKTVQRGGFGISGGSFGKSGGS
ncbi:hypothetical protein BAY61_00745 [Prauserella marina]|uniref:Uncharacterized protein n=1 Tax=Prauserella marina TaxID=530584 RepID=A0A222VIU7_9PSEU|nr:hypothetical protein [Prauserella marina]ASR33752.1 hypothetical protein BAY61_00745 [Prauserella marina]PWV82325.1 hypothetical protein DES30_102565 [Prauserella marina]SDC66364.1 hypothetical protein SAMN05421630_103101 [Prauserella marina]